jgi:hypothetical protein
VLGDPGCLSRIPNLNLFHPRSRIHIKEFKYFNLQKLFLSSRKYVPDCLSRIRILIFYLSRIQGSKRHRIPDTNPKYRKTSVVKAVLQIRIRDPGSGAFLTPGSGIRNRFFPVKSPIFFQHFKNKIIYNFVKFVATKKGMTTNLFSPLSFVPVLGSGMGKNQDPG